MTEKLLGTFNGHTVSIEDGHVYVFTKDDPNYGQPCSVNQIERVFGIAPKDLVAAAYPGRTPDPDNDGHFWLRMFYGEPTGIFYRGLLNHEWRVGYEREGIMLAVTTEGGFGIWYALKHDEPAHFECREAALAWLIANMGSCDSHDLPPMG
jgi:hypothetical protein